MVPKKNISESHYVIVYVKIGTLKIKQKLHIAVRESILIVIQIFGALTYFLK